MNKRMLFRLILLASAFSVPYVMSTHAAKAIIITGDTNNPVNSTFVRGTSVQVTFKVSQMLSVNNPMTITISNEFGKVISSSTVNVTSNSAGNGSVTVSAPSDRLGYFRVSATWANGVTILPLGTRPAGFISYAVVPDPSTRVDYGAALTRFGMELWPWEQVDTVIPYLGVRWLISSAGQWSDLELNYSGQFSNERVWAKNNNRLPFPAQDPLSDNIVLNGKVWQTYSLNTISKGIWPTWAATDNPNRFSCWLSTPLLGNSIWGLYAFSSAFADEVATDYPIPSLHYYQVTWEWLAAPGEYCANGASAQQLVQVYQAVYSQIHAADPKAIVTGMAQGVASADIYSLGSMLAAGFGNYIDALTLHPYTAFPPEGDNGGNLLTNLRQELQMVKQALGHSLPFAVTEFGFTSAGATGPGGFPEPGNELNHALAEIRENIILLGEGSQFNQTLGLFDFWINSPTETANTWGAYWQIDPSNPYFPTQIGPKPLAPAYAAMTYLLDGTTSNGPLSNLSGTQIGYSFQRGSTMIIAVWDWQASSSTANVAVQAGTALVCDWMSNCVSTTSSGSLNLTLGPSPTYIIRAPQ
jgi:hypothetical protein